MRFDTIEADQLPAHLDDLIACYADCYNSDDDFHTATRFRAQITSHATAPAWQAILATPDDNTLVAGYIYGFALAPGTRWWGGLTTDVDDGFTEEDGHRTVAISELMVRPEHRRRGLARALHNQFLAKRPEQRATLLVEQDNPRARALYQAWGWTKTAELRPSWDHAPLFDVMIHRLPPHQ